jgi:hypothetical protein
MRVLIVAKTHLSKTVCVGALAVNGRFLRLLDEHGANPPFHSDYEVRQIWEIKCRKAYKLRPPHTEDVNVLHKEYLGRLDNNRSMMQILKRCQTKIWQGTPEVLFDGCLLWSEKGSGYLNENCELPRNSVGFWLPDKPLAKYTLYEKVRYQYPVQTGKRSLPYVGYASPVDPIPAGTLLRVSLARWWDKDGETEERCSLQLSGWYDLSEPDHQENEVNEGISF